MVDALPKLREDIRIRAVEENSWAIYDMASQKYFKVGYLPFLVLSNWAKASTIEELHERVNRKFPCTYGEVEQIVGFCRDNFLTRASRDTLDSIVSAQRTLDSIPLMKRLAHNYLFFRIHLFNPDIFLAKTLGWIKPLFSARVRYAFVLLLVINLLLIVDNYQEYFSTLVNFVNFEGLVYLGIAVVLLKTAHELGHAYAAKYYGCSVPSMGIAFMVFYPMPYTDTTSAWMLRPSQRIQIAMAGVKVEMVIATFAMALWLLLPDGIAKSLAFFISGVSIATTLAINLTPFMRFDGYYVLSDLWKIENLHKRSFELAKASLRKRLWGIDTPTEHFPPRRRRMLVAFAVATWVYRLILFAGIAYMVYSMMFKALGIVLFAVEIGYFILLPVYNEFKAWYHLRAQARFSAPVAFSWLIVAASSGLLFLPYSHTTRIPAVVESENKSLLYAEYDSHVVYKNEAERVEKGELILAGESVDNDLDRKSATRKLGYFEHQLKNAVTSEETVQDMHKFAQSAIAERAKIAAARSLKGNMQISAPQPGELSYEQPLNAGEYVGAGQKIGTLFDPDRARVVGYVEDTDLSRLSVGDRGVYYDPSSLETFDVEITAIETAPVEKMDEILLDSTYGGSIRVKNRSVSERPNYKVSMSVMNQKRSIVPYKHYGYVKFKTQPSSFVRKVVASLASDLISQSSF